MSPIDADARDRRDLLEITRGVGCREGLNYEHRRAGQEPLLALPDIVAWCWARGGEWRRRAAPLTTDVIDV